jgi:ribulose 1,5-bisphosphate carboxylase large subunit-like protein
MWPVWTGGSYSRHTNPYIDRRPDAFVGEVITSMRLRMSGGDHLHSGTVVGKLEGDRAISAASLGSSVGSWTGCPISGTTSSSASLGTTISGGIYATLPGRDVFTLNWRCLDCGPTEL